MSSARPVDISAAPGRRVLRTHAREDLLQSIDCCAGIQLSPPVARGPASDDERHTRERTARTRNKTTQKKIHLRLTTESRAATAAKWTLNDTPVPSLSAGSLAPPLAVNARPVRAHVLAGFDQYAPAEISCRRGACLECVYIYTHARTHTAVLWRDPLLLLTARQRDDAPRCAPEPVHLTPPSTRGAPGDTVP